MFRALIPLCLLLIVGCGDSGSDTGATFGRQEPSGTDSAPAFRNVQVQTAFVGDDACFSCHEDQVVGYQSHGMANSVYPLTDETVVEEFGGEVVHDSTTGYYYEAVRTDSGFFMLEYRLNDDGSRSHELSREMEYVVGSGTTARTYLTEEQHWFYELPVTWYTQKGRWDFSPGYRVANKRFDRKINDRCIVCHNSYPDPVAQTDGMYESMPFGIGCERCHGPGALHVEERLESPEPADNVDDSIVNPAHLPFDRRMDVCQQCHLNGTISLLRTDRTPYDFRPSQSLEEYVSIFAAHETVSESGDIGVISHVERMKQSACFIGTESLKSPLECTTCHDPHEGFRDEGPSYFNQTCMDCHDIEPLRARLGGSPARDDHQIAANCIDCHMPKAELEEAPHSSFTDHWIRVVEDGPLRPESASSDGTLVPYFERDREGEGILYQGMAAIAYGRQEGDEASLRRGIRLIEEGLDKGHESGEAVYLHGFALQLLGEHEAAVTSLEEAVKADPARVERLNALAQTYEVLGRDPATIRRLYERALSVQPKRVDARLNFGRFLQSAGLLEEARAEYRRAAEDEPWNELAYFNMGTAWLQEGDAEAAERELRRALKLDPLHAASWSNLGLSFLQREEFDQAVAAFERGLEADPRHFETLDNLGTYYLNTDDAAGAVSMLARAVAVRPGAYETRAKLALARFRADDMDGARREAERVLEADPANQLARQILGAL